MSLRIRSALELPAHLRDQVEVAMGKALRKAVDKLVNTPPAPKRQKFGNQVIEEGGETFGSKWELQRYHELQEQQAAGLICELRHHVAYPLDAPTPSGALRRLGAYEADFVYDRGGRTVIEDTKSAATRKHPLFRWKAAHMEAQYGLEVTEVIRSRRRGKSRQVTA